MGIQLADRLRYAHRSVTVVIVIAAMFFLSWQVTLATLILVPSLLVPARIVGGTSGR